MALTLAEIMTRWPQTIHVFVRYHLHCIGCAISRFHTSKDVCTCCDLDETGFRAALLRAISAPPVRPAGPVDAAD